MAKKVQRGLGRGLGALLGEDVVAAAPAAAPEAEPARAADEVCMLPIRMVDPNRARWPEFHPDPPCGWRDSGARPR